MALSYGYYKEIEYKNNNNNNKNNTLMSMSSSLATTSSHSQESTDDWFTNCSSGTTLDDRSSINSIPWAEDAIKQNQDEWEKIQRMFYGEEPLPKDKRIYSEFKEWIDKFPHIRIVGKHIPVPSVNKTNKYNKNNIYEEIFSIHPDPIISSNTIVEKIDNIKKPIGILHSQDCNNEFFIRESASAFRKYNQKDKNEILLNNSLRITSGSSQQLPTNHRINSNDDYFQNHNINNKSPSSAVHRKSAYNKCGQNSEQITSSINDLSLMVPNNNNNNNNFTNYNSSTSTPSTNNIPITITPTFSTYSARLLKIPSIYSYNEYGNQSKSFSINSYNVNKTTKRNPLKSSLTLPAINIATPSTTELLANEIICGRSVSALYHNKSDFHQLSTISSKKFDKPRNKSE